MSNIQELKISKIRRDSGAQFRTELNETHVGNLVEAIERGDALPPVVVFFDGSEYWMGGGDHRIEANIRKDIEIIQADVREGTRDDAEFFGAGDNAEHGLPRSPKTKRAQVTALLKKWPNLGISGIANHAKVSRPFVYQVINDSEELRLTCKRLQVSDREYTTKHGTTATMNTTNIGKHFQGDTSSTRTGADDLYAEFPLSLLTNEGLVFDGTTQYRGLNGLIREDDAPDPTKPLMVWITPDEDDTSFYKLNVFWQGSDEKTATKRSIAPKEVVPHLHTFGVPVETLKAFRWSSTPIAAMRQNVKNITAGGLEMGQRFRDSKALAGDETFAQWVEAEFQMTTEQAQAFIAATDLNDSGTATEREVQRAVNDALEALPELVWLNMVQGIEAQEEAVAV